MSAQKTLKNSETRRSTEEKKMPGSKPGERVGGKRKAEEPSGFKVASKKRSNQDPLSPPDHPQNVEVAPTSIAFTNRPRQRLRRGFRADNRGA